jgi:hypothetical protein
VETIVRSHNRVIEAIHARQPVLPAKFGSVYARAEDIVTALRSARDTLLPQLHRLEGRDEWAVHLYADSAVVRDTIATVDPAIRRLRDEHAAARPGRAYFLEQQLRDAVTAATEQALLALAQQAFDRLVVHAVTWQVSPVGPLPDAGAEVEILRASFLVSRDDADWFMEEVRGAAGIGEGLRAECSGPWPPYSFAAWDEKETK